MIGQFELLILDIECGPRVALAMLEEAFSTAERRQRVAEAHRAFVLRTTPKGVNVPRAEVRRRRAQDKRARRSRRRNRVRA